MRAVARVFALLPLVFGAASAFPQHTGGCVDSPENGTALLAVVGVSGALMSYIRARRLRRTRSGD